MKGFIKVKGLSNKLSESCELEQSPRWVISANADWIYN